VIIGRKVIRLRETTSTMDEIDRLAVHGEAEGLVVVADIQSTGRGRAGRVWQVDAGAGLLFSVLLRPRKAPAEFSFFPLIVGLAVAGAIEQVAGVVCRLKWPNDVLIDEKKVAGILMTSRITHDKIDYVNVGVGINLSRAPDNLPTGATSIAAESNEAVDGNELLDRVLTGLDERYAAFSTSGSHQFVGDWNQRAAFMNEQVTVESEGIAITAIMRGVDDQGALLIERPEGAVERIVVGELTRGPRRVF
jgi:BirA family biotin operon repressor/biotin-[acetyl-CoA-carboxylase] ligase